MSSSSMSRNRGGLVRRALLAVALALGALAVVPAIASAAAVSTSGTVITFTAGGNEFNVLTVTHPATNTYLFHDASTSISESSANCTAASGDVTCNGIAWTSVVVNLGNRDDSVTAAGVNDDPFTINGEVGIDSLTGSDANDVITGAADNDTLNGGSGSDRMDGGADNDTLNGGSGIDRALYSAATAGATVTIDNTANDLDGQGGTDNVQDSVESITGSSFNDTITGSCFANTIVGDPGSTNGSAGGNDTLNGDPASCPGGNGADILGGGEGNDIFDGDGTTGAAGFDTVTYGTPYTGAVAATCAGQAVTAGFAVNLDTDNAADDCDGFGNTTENVHSDIERIVGSGAADRVNAASANQGVQLLGRDGNDTLLGSPFGDFLWGEDGADTLDCAGGTDTYRTNGGDASITNCETPV
ncbi:MAG TPA: calcium-binding protein [Solirubrobacterales bacterium]|nr:calcium-binding protein [Solirubrobacterales bacterium]